ncbi:tetratricopeptide repeat protein [Amycolatopsis anabasis]|uniref:tetratricopeptide repeat protein n=1 Tax=Amycolatopsis anabasis TaxID=1840409 RepID=UPI00131D79A4|nr:hypothetical protein [Amycolatopsis anabasis]
MRTLRVPNNLLRELLTEAGWTGQALASAINALGAETGLRLQYQRASVTQWLSGTHPRPPVPELVAEAFSRKLGRPITVAATGLGPSEQADPGPWWEEDAVTRLVELCEDGVARREVLAGCVYSLAALSLPGWADLISAHPSPPPEGSAAARVGQAEADSAATMIGLFSDTDTAFGGGRARLALATYLRTTVAPWLRADASSKVHRELLVTAARLTYLCGFMCFDDELHGAAQRYYLTGLQLSGEAGDATGYAVTLRALSVQARLLGHHREAVNLAESAARVTTKVSTETRAFVYGQLAVANAANGDQRSAHECLGAAEKQLERVSSARTPVGAYHPAALSHQHAAIRACTGDRRGAITALTTSVRHRPIGERRSRAITLARLAELQLDDGQLEQACGTWERFLDDYPYLWSRRADTALHTLRARLRPHAKSTCARSLLTKATALSKAPSMG